MKKITIGFLTALFCAVGATANDNKDAAQKVPIQRTYTGRVYVHGQTPEDDDKVVLKDPIVVRNQKQFDAFVAVIPTREITRVNPAPPSDDPLLKKPKIDFKRQMLIVAFRTDTMYSCPEIQGVRIEQKKLIVSIKHAALGEMSSYAQVRGIGTYCAVLIPKSDLPVDFRVTKEKE